MAETIGTLFENCVQSQGSAFDAAEQTFVRLGVPALPYLRAQIRSNPDPMARQIALVLFQAIGGRLQIFRGAMKHLEQAEGGNAGTPRSAPRSDCIAASLEIEFASRPAAYLAVHLAKNPSWPEWKVASVSHYLSAVNSPQALPAVVRFAATNAKKHYANLAQLALSGNSAEAVEKANRNERKFQAGKK